VAEGDLETIDIQFVSGVIPADELVAHGIWGREEISRLFSFDVFFSRAKGALNDEELDSMLKAPCAIALGGQSSDVVHGILESVEVLDASQKAAPRYLARMVPSVWLLSLSRASRVFQNITVPDMVRSILDSNGMREGKHFNILVNRNAKSPQREYIVQYQESDWDFICRWLETEGFFYWFAHDAEGEMLFIADENGDASEIEKPAVPFRERNNLSTGGEGTVWDWALHQRRVPSKLTLLEYNYRRPDIMLAVTTPVEADRGWGTVVQYGEHFKDNETGKAIAQLRAERLACERRIFSGTTDCSRFRVGHTFDLTGHFEKDNDKKYLITSIEHRVGEALDREGQDPHRYEATFECIPHDVIYRPPRLTPWPRIQAIVSAFIEGDGSGEYAEIDDEGRYKVRLPFDMSLQQGMAASRWIRMAQGYAGAAYGIHHPLHKGTEVLLVHVDGDPDRPIIIGAVPNTHTVSPVTRVNATQSVTQTASGIRIEMEDLQS
jgi:type VI secretion system secreted protein VgrG